MTIKTAPLSPRDPWPQEAADLDQLLAVEIPMTPVVPVSLTKKLFAEENPYWLKGQARAFWVPGRGRMVGFMHEDSQTSNGESLAFFGYWATENDAALTAALMKSVSDWARSLGALHLAGPVNLKTFYDYRVRLDDFDAPPFFGEPTNPAYYPGLLRGESFEISQMYVTDIIDDLDRVRTIADRRLPRLHAEKANWNFVPLSEEILAQSPMELIALANRLFSKNTGFQPVEPFDFAMTYNRDFLRKLCPRTSFLLQDPEGAFRGLCISFPHPHDPEFILIKTIGIDDDQRHAGRTFAEFLQHIFEQSVGYKRMAFCLMTEGNAGHRLAAKYCHRRRTYGLFAKKL